MEEAAMKVMPIGIAQLSTEFGRGVEQPAPSQPVRPATDSTRAQDDTAGLRSAVRDINSFVQTQQRNLEFSVDEDTGMTVVKVVDPQTGDVIRQIPSEVALSLARALSEGDEFRDGFMLRDRA